MRANTRTVDTRANAAQLNGRLQNPHGRRLVALGRECCRDDVRSYFGVGHIRGDGLG